MSDLTRFSLWSLISFLGLPLVHLAAEESSSVLRTGFPLHALNNIDSRDAKVATGHLLKTIVEDHNVTYTAEVIEDNNEFLANMTGGSYDFFLIFGYDYLRLRDTYPMRPILVGQYDEESVLEELLLITSSVFDTFTDLSDATLLIPRGAGELSMRWLNHWLTSQQLGTGSKYFQLTKTTDNVSKALLPVFFGKADACIIPRSGYNLMNELNPQIGRRTKIHAHSMPLLKSVLCLSPTYGEKESALVKREGLRLNTLPHGEQLITLLRMKRLVAWDPAFLKNLEDLLQNDPDQPPIIVDTSHGKETDEP